MGLRGITIEIRVKGDKIRYRSIFGRVREYAISDITSTVSNHNGKLRIYSEKKRIFTLSDDMNGALLESELTKRGVPVIDTKGMTVDNHVIKAYGLFKYGFTIVLIFFICLVVGLLSEKELLLATLFAIFTLPFLYGTFSCFINQIEVRENTVIYRGFLKKKVEININQISCIREELKSGILSIVVYKGKKGVMNIYKYSNGITLFRGRMYKERKKWYENKD
jgi:hypothetical protein